MTITKPARRFTTLCRGAAHLYCLEGCDCTCHFQVEASSKLTSLAYELWRARAAFRLPQESLSERRQRLLRLLQSLALTVDYEGHSAASLVSPLMEIIEEDSWSLGEASAKLQVKARF